MLNRGALAASYLYRDDWFIHKLLMTICHRIELSKAKHFSACRYTIQE